MKKKNILLLFGLVSVISPLILSISCSQNNQSTTNNPEFNKQKLEEVSNNINKQIVSIKEPLIFESDTITLIEIKKQLHSKLIVDQNYDYELYDLIIDLTNKKLKVDISIFDIKYPSFPKVIKGIELPYITIATEQEKLKENANDFKAQVLVIQDSLMVSSTNEINIENVENYLRKNTKVNSNYNFNLNTISNIQNGKFNVTINFYNSKYSDINQLVQINGLNYKLPTTEQDELKENAEIFKNKVLDIKNPLLISSTDKIDQTTVKKYISENINIDSDYNFDVISVSNIQDNKFDIIINFYSNKNNTLIEKLSINSLNYKISSKAELMFDLVCKNIKLIPIKNYDYKTITAKEYYELPNFGNQINKKSYFDLNLNELSKLIEAPITINDFEFFWKVKDKSYDFKNPNVVTFSIDVSMPNYSNIPKTNVDFKINDFKNDDSTIGFLDKQPIVELKTPSTAVSYKGELEKFKISEITIAGTNAYKDALKKMTWNDKKLSLMYQIRFALYQMFSDNFSEINYWLIDNEATQSLHATGVGIIKEDRNNVKYGFQYLGNSSQFMRTTDLKKGQKVEVSIEFNNLTRITCLDQGELNGFDDSWWWNFDDNCNKYQDNNNPLYLKNLFRDSWSSNETRLSIKVNGTQTYSLKPQQYSHYNFLLKRKYQSS